MSTTTNTTDGITAVVPRVPPLETGDHLDRETFHVRYEAMPPGTRAELIGGIVYMASPVKLPHARLQRLVSGWLNDYERRTPGVEGADGVTLVLDEESEPQPDSCLYILPENGGQVRTSDHQYITGAPELIVEIASSTESYDLHSKKDDYQRAGVCEYVVVAVRQGKVFWFVLRNGIFHGLQPHEGRVHRSVVFPGLWLDSDALLKLDGRRLLEVLEQGCVSDEHAHFVRKLSTSG